LNEKCSHCALPLAKNDVGDGAAVFLIFILGFLLVPAAAVFEFLFAPPLWVHGLLWGGAALAATIFSLKPLKAYILLLQYKYRPDSWSS
jgi:uncharacterized protein (DUF983 family)